MYWICVYKYNDHYSGMVHQSIPHRYRGFKEVLKIPCRIQKVKRRLKETQREWKEDIED